MALDGARPWLPGVSGSPPLAGGCRLLVLLSRLCAEGVSVDALCSSDPAGDDGCMVVRRAFPTLPIRATPGRRPPSTGVVGVCTGWLAVRSGVPLPGMNNGPTLFRGGRAPAPVVGVCAGAEVPVVVGM